MMQSHFPHSKVADQNSSRNEKANYDKSSSEEERLRSIKKRKKPQFSRARRVDEMIYNVVQST